jgi:predicted transcriptional regulator
MEESMTTLRDLREKKLYLSRRELAELANVSESTLVRMEQGGNVKKDVVEKVLKIIGEKLGYEVPIQSIEGLVLYNIVRDRRPGTGRPKKAKAS